MNATRALKEYIGQEPNAGDKLGAKELLEFKNSCTPEEYQGYGRQACEALGEPYDPPESKA